MREISANRFEQAINIFDRVVEMAGDAHAADA